MRFFLASGCPIATTTLYRCVHLSEQLRALGHEAEVVEWFQESSIKPEPMRGFDVVVLYRSPMTSPVRRVIGNARAARSTIIFDTDDLIFEPDLISAQRAVLKLTAAEQAQHAHVVGCYLEALQACDGVLTATPFLAELAGRRNKRAFVHRNALGQEMLALAEQLQGKREQRAADEKVVIGYGSGTETHDFDFREAAPALIEILDRHPEVELWIAGPLSLPRELEASSRLRRFPLTDWHGWFELASQFDLALAPLEMENVFCQAKSEIKFVEAGALGVPVIASRTGAFSDAIRHGVDGLLASNQSEWSEALRSLISQPEERRAMGARARATVLQRYSPEARALELRALLPHLIPSLGQTGEEPRERRGWVTKMLKKFSPAQKRRSLVINWLVPEPTPHAGGCVGIFRLIRHLEDFGHQCFVHIVPYGQMMNFSTEEIREFVDKHFDSSPAHQQKWNGTVGDADGTFATFWPTAENLLALPNGGRRFYLVQDFEPSFYPGDQHHSQRAEDTYRAGLHCITLGPWLAKLLRERYRATADHFDFAVETKTYWPRPGLRSAHRRVCFYARPATPRRAYELGVEALERVKQRRPEVEIVFFGTGELTPRPAFSFVNKGFLQHDALATLFSSSDVGLVLSLTNPSFVPLEMMACRCAVAEIASERYEGVLTHGQDAWLVEEKAEAIAEGIMRLLQDDELRARLVAQASDRTGRMDWRHSARQIEAILLRSIPSAA